MSSITSKVILGLLKQLKWNALSAEEFLKKAKISQYSVMPEKYLSKTTNITNFKINGNTCYRLSSETPDKNNLLLYLHGGAYVGALTKEHWQITRKILNKTHRTTYVPDYPLTPIHTYRDTLEFVLEVYQTILKENPNKKIILMGDSAGAGLAFALSYKLRELKEPQPEKIIALCPWLDVTMESAKNSKNFTKEYVLNYEFLKTYGTIYSSEDSTNPLVSPLFGDPTNLPPTLIFTCTGDLLNEESRVYRDKAMKAGHPILYHEAEELFHNYMLFPLKESKIALKEIVATIIDT